MTEQKIQKQIIELLEARKFYVIKIQAASKAGIPDIIACSPEGRFIAIEVKTLNTRDNVSALQKYNLYKIRRTGGISMVAWSVDMVKEFFGWDT